MPRTERHGSSSRTTVTTCTVAILLCLATATGGVCHAGEPAPSPRDGQFAARAAIPSVPLSSAGLPGRALQPTDVATRLRADDALRSPGRRGSRFVHQHLVPELTNRFLPMSTRSSLSVLGLGAPQSNASRELNDVIGRDAGKAAERAVTDWLLAVTDLEARALSWVAGPRARFGRDSTTSRGRPGIAVGLSHGLPRTELIWSVGRSSTLRVSLQSYGGAAIEFDRRGARNEHWGAGWDGENDGYRLQYRRTF